MNPKTILLMFGSAAFGVIGGVAVDVGAGEDVVVTPLSDADIPAGVVRVELNDNHGGDDPCTGIAAYKGDDGVVRGGAIDLPCSTFADFGEGMTRLRLQRDRDGLCRGQIGGPAKGSFAVVVTCDALDRVVKDATPTTPLEVLP